MLNKWITNGTDRPFYARENFVIEKEITSAVAKVCGLGQFVFHVNGQKVDDHELDPGWTNYNKLIEYVTFDVTPYLHQGENVIGAEVGNGWYIKTDEHYTFAFPEFMPPNPNPYKPFGKSLVLAVELIITYADGSAETIEADESFAVKEHPVIMSNVYGSETIDGRLVQERWSSADYDASGWQKALIVDEKDVPKGELIEQFQPAVKVIHTYEGKYLGAVSHEGETGRVTRDIYDFGQNMSGILEFAIFGKKSDTVQIYSAEKLTDNGDVDQMAKGWVNLDSRITYIVGKDDVWETCRMKFTYFAGRYIAVEKISKTEPDGMKLRYIKAHAISSAYETDGTFCCDDVRLMKIYDMIEKTVEANMLGVHTDCPTIERFAWQEPNHLMSSAIFYMKNGRKLWEKFLLDMRVEQHKAEDYFYDFEGNKVYPGDGLMPSQCPCYIPNVLPVPGMGSFYDIITWGSTCILGTWWHYQFYGDKQVIEDNYVAGKRYLNHLKTKVTGEGFINHGLGDWGNPKNELARENVETAFLYADAVTLAKFAGILGKEDEQTEFLKYAEEIRVNYNEKLLVKHPEKDFYCYCAWDHTDEVFLTPAIQALPLFWGMVPENWEEDVVKAFRFALERDGAFISGEVGLPYIIQTARRYGMNDLITKFILKEEHPSYYAFILDGETTLGEYWESNPRSHCHDMLGHIIEWYYNGIAGIQPKEPGFRSVLIRPYLPESVHEFDCTYQSVSGKIRIHVQETEETIVLETKIDNKIQYTIDITELECRGKAIEVKEGERHE